MILSAMAVILSPFLASIHPVAVPHAIGDVLPLLSPDLHPVDVHNFFTLPNVDLRVEELARDLSPREWLQAGYPPNAVADLAAALE